MLFSSSVSALHCAESAGVLGPMGSFSCTASFCKGRQVENQRQNFWQFPWVKRCAGDATSGMYEGSHVGSVMDLVWVKLAFEVISFLHFQTVNICPSIQEIPCCTGDTRHSGKIAVPSTQVSFGTGDNGLRVLYITSLCNFSPFYYLTLEVVTKRVRDATEEPVARMKFPLR